MHKGGQNIMKIFCEKFGDFLFLECVCIVNRIILCRDRYALLQWIKIYRTLYEDFMLELDHDYKCHGK